MTTQSEDYENLLKLEQKLVEDRRSLVSAWEANDTDAMDAARKVAEVMAALEAVRAAAKEERQAGGAATFLA